MKAPAWWDAALDLARLGLALGVMGLLLVACWVLRIDLAHTELGDAD